MSLQFELHSANHFQHPAVFAQTFLNIEVFLEAVKLKNEFALKNVAKSLIKP